MRVMIFSLFFLFCAACANKNDSLTHYDSVDVPADMDAAGRASAAASQNKDVSEADAIAAKAEFDKITDETSAEIDKAEVERMTRDKKLKNKTCIENCSGN